MQKLVRRQIMLENELRKARVVPHNNAPYGWLADTATWTYASASTFTVAGDVTAQFTVGLHIKLTQTTDKYFYVVSSVYDGSTNTTVTVAGRDQETPDTLANAAITAPYTWVSAVDVTAGYVLQAAADGSVWAAGWTFGEWSSTSWDGDAKLDASDGTIDLSAVFGLPAGIKAISIRLDVKSSTVPRYGAICKDVAGLAWGVISRSIVANSYTSVGGIVECDANGDVYWSAGGDLTGVSLYINAYLP